MIYNHELNNVINKDLIILLPFFHAKLLYVLIVLRAFVSISQSTHRVAIADFWRTFHHDGKSALAGEGGGARPPPFTLFTITYKVAVYAPAERQIDRYTPIYTLYVLCAPFYR